MYFTEAQGSMLANTLAGKTSWLASHCDTTTLTYPSALAWYMCVYCKHVIYRNIFQHV